MLVLFTVAGLVCFAAIRWRMAASHPVSQSAAGSVSVDHGDETDKASFTSRAAGLPRSSPAEARSQLAKEIENELKSDDETVRAGALTDQLPRLVAMDAAAAGRLAEATGPDAGRGEMLRDVAQAWASADPTGALAWAAQLADPDEQRLTLMNVVVQMAQADPAAAVAAAQKHHLDDGFYDILPSLAVQWANEDLTGAVAWAGNLPAGGQRDEIMARIAFVESQNAPVDAGNRVLTEIPSGTVQEEAVMTVLHQWSLQDLVGAQAWAQKFPEGSLKDRALAELAVMAARHN